MEKLQFFYKKCACVCVVNWNYSSNIFFYVNNCLKVACVCLWKRPAAATSTRDSTQVFGVLCWAFLSYLVLFHSIDLIVNAVMLLTVNSRTAVYCLRILCTKTPSKCDIFKCHNVLKCYLLLLCIHQQQLHRHHYHH